MQKVRLRGDAIRKILAMKNQTQNWLAIKIGITSGHMAQLLNGIKNPSPNTREKIKSYFVESTFEDLFELMK